MIVDEAMRTQRKDKSENGIFIFTVQLLQKRRPGKILCKLMNENLGY